MWRKYLQHVLGISAKDKRKAFRTRQKLAILYAFVGWNCFGVAIYVLLNDKLPKDDTERRMSYRHLFGMPETMHVYQFSGLQLTKDFKISFKTEEEKETAATREEIAEVNEH